MSRWRTAELDEAAYADLPALSARLGELGLHLTADELELARDRFGRIPRWAELVCLNVLWSEHCSYRSTRHLLKRLPTEAKQVVLGPGQDAGVVEIGEHEGRRYGAVLAHESHNHPSQVVPYEGAATGVGGIVRDVACMGAHVVATCDPLRFGTGARRGGAVTRDIIREVVRGVGEYGNALGVPNLGGDVYFDDGFDANCLVNVVAAGLVPLDGIVPSAAPPNRDSALVLVGKPTDDSGFGGAAFASTVLSEVETERRGAVQLPDPFLLRALTVANEALLEKARGEGWSIGCKDLGAGGLACASVELADASGLGADLWLDRIHRIPEEIPPWVLLCAETQERYCWAVPWERAEEVCVHFNEEHKLGEVYPGAGASCVGRIRDDGRYVVTWAEETLIDCPASVLTAGIRSPREAKRRPVPRRRRPSPRPESVRGTDSFEIARRLLGGYELGSRAYLYERYDCDVQGLASIRRGEAAAGVVAPVPGAPWGMALAVAGNPYWCAADPELGAAHAVAEAARRVASVGATPWALTDCLNFGSALEPEVMGDLESAIDGLARAARALGAETGEVLPYVSGNVSLYNQDESGVAIPPSPIVSCLGRIANLGRTATTGLRAAGDVLLYLGAPRGDLSGSQFARTLLNAGKADGAPELDLEAEARRNRALVDWIEAGWVRAARPTGAGGLALAIASMAFRSPDGLGATIEWRPVAREDVVEQAVWWSEEPGFVCEVEAAQVPRLLREAVAGEVPVVPVGVVASDPVLIARGPGEEDWRWDLRALREPWERALVRVWEYAAEPLEVGS